MIRSNSKKTPWPTVAVMKQIYAQYLWGGKEHDFYSGEGSHNPSITKPYLETVIAFLKAKQPKLTVCDLGCGDFNIGRHLVNYTQTYYAIDIVDALIERNKKLFKAKNLIFQCLDISKDVLPNADCAILRQVLQHLSNEEVLKIISQLYQYRYIILTEHLPFGNFVPNKNIISGQGIRLKYESGIDLSKEPFNLKTINELTLSDLDFGKGKGRITTTLYTLS